MTNIFKKQGASQVALVLGVAGLFASVAAMNGGTALTASVFDTFLASVQGMLSSSYVLAAAMIALFVVVWNLMHGKGYGALSWVLGILLVALVGPGFVTTLSTTTRHPVAQVQVASAHVSLPSTLIAK